MGLLSFLEGIAEIADAFNESFKDDARNKTLEQLINGINTNNGDTYFIDELKSRLAQLSNRELIENYEEYCYYSDDIVISIFKKEINKRGMTRYLE